MCGRSSTQFNEEGFDSLRPDYRGGRPRRITTTERQRPIAVAGARPDTQGVPLTRWWLDRLSAWPLTADRAGVMISPSHLGRLPSTDCGHFDQVPSLKAL